MSTADTSEIWGTTEVGTKPQQLTAAQVIIRFTLAAMRVFMAEWAYKAGVPRGIRKDIGRWSQEKTSEVYTREHRHNIKKIWDFCVPKRHLMENFEEVPCNIDDEHYWGNDPPPMGDNGNTFGGDFTMVEELEKEDSRMATGSGTGDRFPESRLVAMTAGATPPMDEQNTSDPEQEEASPDRPNIMQLVEQDEDQQKEHDRSRMGCGSLNELLQLSETRVHADAVPTKLGGPLTPKISRKRTGEDRTRKVHLVKQDETSVGCGYKAHNYSIFTQADAMEMASRQNVKENSICAACFKNFTWPKDWHIKNSGSPDTPPEMQQTTDHGNESSTEDSIDTDSDSMMENDSLSEEEAFVPAMNKEKKAN